MWRLQSRKAAFAIQPTIAIVGFSVRAAAQCAHQAGLSVVAIDACLDRDLLAICADHHPLAEPWLNWLNESHPTIPVLLAGGMENEREIISQLSKHAHAMGVRSAEQMATLRSIDHWERWAIPSDIRWPITIQSSSSLSQLSQHPGEWIMKSVRSAGGLGVSDIDVREPNELDRIVQSNQFDESGGRYLQSKILGSSIGVTFLSSKFGSVVVGAARSIESSESTGLSRYAYRGSLGPISIQQIDRLNSFANLVATETGILGLWQADFIVDESETEWDWTLLEINPRWTSSMELLDSVFDIPLVSMHLQCCDVEIEAESWIQIQSQLRHSIHTCDRKPLIKTIIYATDDFVVTEQCSDNWWSKRWDGTHHVNGSCFADIPSAGTRISRGQPVLSEITSK